MLKQLAGLLPPRYHQAKGSLPVVPGASLWSIVTDPEAQAALAWPPVLAGCTSPKWERRVLPV